VESTIGVQWTSATLPKAVASSYWVVIAGTTAPASTTRAASSASAANQRTESLAAVARRNQARPAMASRRTDVGRSRMPAGVTTSSEEWKP
jgi:hypothetical protein